jgi:hypothetical protein
MSRLVHTVTACVLAAAISLAVLSGVGSPAAEGAPARAHAPRATLSQAAAVRQMRAFVRSAVQVTAVGSSFEIRGCRRRGARTVDCRAHIPGRSTATLRAKLIGKRAKRIQLYVVAVTPAG